MSPKTFRGRSLEEARKAALAELGSDAVIVATRKISKPKVLGLFGSEEYEVSATPKPRPIDAFVTKSQHPFVDMARFGVPPKQVDEVEAIRTEVRNEVRALRALFTRSLGDDRGIESTKRELEAEIADLYDLIVDMRSDHEREPPAQIKRQLAAVGLEGTTARLVGRRVKERGDGAAVSESFRAALLELLRIGPWPLENDARTLVALVGPTGVGKTTTAAKLAAHAILEQRRTVTLVGCDGFRVGAIEQLERFAALLGAEFRMAKTRHGLEEAIATSQTDVTIVDTAGRGPSEKDGVEAALPRIRHGKNENLQEKHVLLCVPAALREVDAKRVARFYHACGPTGVVVTKLDETAAPSGLLHAPLAAKLPLSALCFGQRVPEDIAPASHKHALDALCPPPKRASRSVAS